MPTKISQSQVKELLTALGLDVEVVEDEKTADKDVDITALSETAFEDNKLHLTQEIKETLTRELEPSLHGKFIKTLRAAAKRTFGLTESEVAELSTEKLLSLAKDKVLANGNKVNEDWVNEKTDLLNQIEDLKTQHETKIGELTASHQAAFTDREVNDAFLKVITDLPRKGGNVSAHVRNVMLQLKSDYNYKINPETKEIEFYDKNQPEKRVFGENKKVLTSKDYAQKYLTDVGDYATDMSHKKPSDVKKDDYKPGIGQINPEKSFAEDVLERYSEVED